MHGASKVPGRFELALQKCFVDDYLGRDPVAVGNDWSMTKLANLRIPALESNGETFGCGQLGNSVDHSPRKQRELKRVSSGQLSLVLTCLDEGRQRPEGLFGGFGLVRTRALRNRRIEHHRKVLRSTESELDVGESGDFQSIQRLRLPLGGVAHGPGQLPESLGSDGCQKFFPIRKVPIRGVVGDACAPGDFPQSKARGTDLADQLNCRFQQSFFQMGVVVRLSWTHSSQQHTTYGWHEQHAPICTEICKPTFICNHVDTRNI